MEKIMRNAPSLAILITLILQVTRVSEFGDRLGAGILAVVFALFLGASIYVLSYWQAKTRYEVTADKETEHAKYAQQVRVKQTNDRVNRTAGGWLAAFVIIEGYLNLAETMARLPAGLSMWEFSGALMYGIFPTLAAFGLGNLQALIDKVPHGVEKKSLLQAWLDSTIKRIESQGENLTSSTPKVTGKLPESPVEETKVSETPEVTYPHDWRKARKLLTLEQVEAMAQDETENIAFHFGQDKRTALNWRNYARIETGTKSK